MTKEERDQALGELERLAEWAREATHYQSFVVERDEYYFDAGVFGEVSAPIYLEEEDYEIDVSDVFAQSAPINPTRIEEIVDALREEPDAPETLDEVLDRMKTSGTAEEQKLAQVVSVVVGVIQDRAISPASGNELPPAPLPWPGALRPEIDYTAPDFPLRYQPPPGFDWSKTGKGEEIAASYREAVAIDVSVIDTAGGRLLIDDKGRIRWNERADGNYENGARWLVWTAPREGIPRGTLSFKSDTPPMALDEAGHVIDEGLEKALTQNFSGNDITTAHNALEELKKKAAAQGNGASKFDPPKPVSV